MIRAIDLSDAEVRAQAARPRKMMMSNPGIETPEELEHLVIERASPAVRMGIWKCGPYTDEIVDYGYDEFMHIVEGSVELVYPDGGVDRFGPGQTFLLPRGFTGTWKQEETVVKYFVMVA